MMNPIPDKMSLSATVRSFEANHPDFETEALTYVKDAFGNFERDVAGNLIKFASVETGIVAPRLVEGKPVYNENRLQNRGQTTTGSVAFEQWFSDIHPAQQRLTFDFGRRDGVYVFEDRAFFPLNPQGQPLWNKLFSADGEALTAVGRDVLAKIRAVHPDFGQGLSDVEAMKQRYDNESVRNNAYHFTLEAEARFIYRGDEEFAFFGDDDLWVFIDDKLVMDLGGLHPPLGCQDLAAGRRQSEDKNSAPMPGYLDLRSTNPRNRSFSSNTLRLRLRDDLGITHANEYLELVLTVGQPYTMKVFYAERHTLEANCCFYTTLQFAEAEATAAPASWVQTPELVATPSGYAGGATESVAAPSSGVYTETRPTEAPAAYAGSTTSPEATPQPTPVTATTSAPGADSPVPQWIGGIDLNDPKLWDYGDRIICVTPVRTIIRREEEITLIRRVRKVEEVDASPACPVNTTPVNQYPSQG